MDTQMRNYILNLGALVGGLFAAFDIYSYLFDERLPVSQAGGIILMLLLLLSVVALSVGTIRYRTKIGGYASFRTMFTVFTLSAFAASFIMTSVKTVPLVIDPDLKNRMATYQADLYYDMNEEEQAATMAVSKRFLPDGEDIEDFDQFVDKMTDITRNQSTWVNFQSLPLYALMYAVIGLIVAAVTQRKQRFE